MPYWATELANHLVQEEQTGLAWDEFTSEAQRAQEEFSKIFKVAKSKMTVVANVGAQAIEVRDDRNRKLSFTLNRPENTVKITRSWEANSEYVFKISSGSILRKPLGAIYPGLTPAPSIEVKAVIEATFRSLLHKK